MSRGRLDANEGSRMTEVRTRDRIRGSRGPARPARAINGWLIGIAVGLALFQMFLLPLVLLPRGAMWGWTLVVMVLSTTPFWSLIHEAIHGSLIRGRGANDACGRVLGVLYGSPFAMLKAGHLLHHRYSRTRERTEIYDPATSSWVQAAPGYYLRLFGGLYLLEVAAVLLAVLPASVLRRLGRLMDAPDSVTGLLFERIAQARVLGRFRVDAAAIVVLYAAAFVAYGAYGWMLLAALGGRALVISLSDNAYHYGTELDAPLEAMNLRTLRSLERFALSFNLHGVHHRHPGLRWYELRAKFLDEGGHYHLGWATAAARQIRGPIKLR
ncbi:fatty acid desaturase family protein [Nocardia pseudovaccinii]|uniref:fatty acid desaturase family protein n=1 Tax=Nocardia pseudovaccinii TaxID=189540 RepID=UPI001FE19DFA|nr:fatty acid desaturase [Nocardia pseudovaccinii]